MEPVKMNFDMYQQEALRTAGKQETESLSLCMAAMGLAGEAGETCDLVKKIVFHGHPMDREKVKKEIGDVLWYAAVLAERCGWTLSEIAEANVAKLRARYPAGFDANLSQNRKAGDV